MITEERKAELRRKLASSMDRDMRKHRSDVFVSFEVEWICNGEEEEEYLYNHCKTQVVCMELPF